MIYTFVYMLCCFDIFDSFIVVNIIFKVADNFTS